MSANIRFASPDDGVNVWPNRRDLLVKILLKQDPDLIACQEVTPAQGAFLDKELGPWFTHYPRPGVGTIEGSKSGGVSGELMNALSNTAAGLNTLFYRTDRFEQMDGLAGLVLPNAPQANPSENTFFTLAVLRDKLGATAAGGVHFPDLIVIDTHLRHSGDFAIQCARRLHQIAGTYQAKYPGSQVIVMGDFNHDRTEPVYVPLVDAGAKPPETRWVDAFDYRLRKPGELWGTFHNFTGRADRANPTDLIFVTPGLKASPAEILRDAGPTGRYPTDHFLIKTELEPAGSARPGGNGGA
ncbi:MAG TPA: endonuclease/exonuclease/phosphatase family protein [Phycisphaerae bacterium]|nr:endonuclease/exonuclease/phosphatase family protein [Phycisphaerae bacterium]